MKQKIFGLLLALMLAVSATACTDTGTLETSKGESVSKESQTGKESDDAGAGQESNGTETVQGSEMSLPVAKISSEDNRYIFRSYYTNHYTITDNHCKMIAEYDFMALCRKLYDAGKGNFEYASIRAVGEDVLYVEKQDQVGDAYVRQAYAIDPKTLDTFLLYTPEEGWWWSETDVYQGKVYVTAFAYDAMRSKELVFVKDPNGFTYQEEKNPNEALIESLNGYRPIPFSPSLNAQCSITRAMDEVGFVIAEKDYKYYSLITRDGKVIEVPELPQGPLRISAYDNKGIVYYANDESGLYGMYCLNLETRQSRPIVKDDERYEAFLAYADGKIYYYTQSEGFIHVTNTVWQYDVTTGSEKKLYAMESTPGIAYIDPGVEEFRLIDGEIYFVGLNGTTDVWLRATPNGETVSLWSTGIYWSDLSENLFVRGTVIYDTYSFNCPYCGIPLEKYYGEAFQVKEHLSTYADKINEQLRADLQQKINDYQKNETQEWTDEECEEHLEMPIIYCVTVEEYVDDAYILSDQYLAVEYSGYWYGGGAHGMPYMSQDLFDLKTGERKTFKDFYDGSNESFKKLAAEYTKKDFLSYPEGSSPYFAEDAETVYQQAYDAASIEYSHISFQTYGIYLIYDPYEMGPYASGFIEIYIPYEELLGRYSL